jgi:flagellar biogenesis protein FliO
MEIPLWLAIILVILAVVGLFWGIWKLKQRNPASRGVERKLQQKKEDHFRNYNP